jgi:hypothetical protein
LRAAAWFLLLTPLSPLTGCHSKVTDEPDTFVILVDKSASTSGPKNASYADYLKRYVFPSLTPGATVILEPIVGANTHSDPSLRIVATLPNVTRLHRDLTYYLLKGDMGVDKKCMATVPDELQHFYAAREQFAEEGQHVLQANEASADTFLLDGMKEASESLEQRTGRGILIILSDGLEDSNTDGNRLRFNDGSFWTHHPPAKFAQSLDPAKDAPGLKAITVYLFGLAAGSGPIYGNVRAFWKDYFDDAKVQKAAIGHQPIYEEKPFAPTAKELCQ